MEGAPWESDRAECDVFWSWSEAFLMVFRGGAMVWGSKSRVCARMRERASAPSYSPNSPVRMGQKCPVGTPRWDTFLTCHGLVANLAPEPRDRAPSWENPSDNRITLKPMMNPGFFERIGVGWICSAL